MFKKRKYLCVFFCIAIGILLWSAIISAAPRIIIRGDEELWELFILANVAGYNLDNGQAYSPLRKMAREYAVSHAQSCIAATDDFRAIFRNDPFLAGMMTKLLGRDSEERGKLHELVNRYSKCAGLKNFFKKHRQKLEDEKSWYSHSAKNLVGEILRQTGGSKSFSTIVIIPNSFDANGRGWNIETDGNEHVLVIGPGDERQKSYAVAHEILHPVIDKAVSNIQGGCPAIERKYQELRRNNSDIIQGYPSWQFYLAENMVHGVASFLLSSIGNGRYATDVELFVQNGYAYAGEICQYLQTKETAIHKNSESVFLKYLQDRCSG